MKLFKWMTNLLLMVVLLTSCGGDNGADFGIHIGVISMGSVDDSGMTQSLFTALEKLQNEEGNSSIRYTLIENVAIEDAKAHLAKLAQDGASLIVAHSDQYLVPTLEIAEQYPETSFAIGMIDEVQTLNNVFVYSVAAYESGYVNGVVATLLSRNQAVAIFHDENSADTDLYNKGFAQAVNEINSETFLEIIYVDSNTAVQSLNAQLASGADVFSGGSEQLFRAVEQSEQAWLSVYSDQNISAPNVVMAQKYDWTIVFDEILFEMESETIGGESFWLTYENSGIILRYGEVYPIPTEVLKISEEALFNVINGTIDFDLDEQH